MNDVSIKRKYIATLIVCIVFVMIVGSHCCNSECDMCPLDTSSWAGLSNTNTIYPGGYPPDINVSSTPGNMSATSGSKRDIAVDATGRVHTVWIETKNDVRNVYYACSLPTGNWAKTNVSQFPTMEDKKFQARNASIAVTPGGVPHIAWEVEIDNNETPLTLEENDNHYVYYVYGSSDCPQTSWKTCGGNDYSPPLPSHTPGPGSYNNANVSRNDSNSSHYDAWNPAIALDNNHRPHITWQNEIDGNYKIFWVYCDDEDWKTCGGQDYHFENISTCNAIVSQSNSSHYLAPSIAIDTENNVHIAYHSETPASSIYYVGISSGSTGYDCQQPIDTGNSGKYASIAVDSDNKPHIVWEDGSIKYSNYSGTDWSGPGTIPGNQDCHAPCLALDRDDKPHIVYYCNSNNNQEIFYSYNLSSPINVSHNSDNSFSPSLALDNNCNPHLLWTDETPEAEREVLYVHLQCL